MIHIIQFLIENLNHLLTVQAVFAIIYYDYAFLGEAEIWLLVIESCGSF